MTPKLFLRAGPDGRTRPLIDQVLYVPCPGCGGTNAVRRDFERLDRCLPDGSGVLIHAHDSTVCACGYKECDALHPTRLLWWHTCSERSAPALHRPGQACPACLERASHGLRPGDGETSNLSLAYTWSCRRLDVHQLPVWIRPAALGWCQVLAAGCRIAPGVRAQFAFGRLIGRTSEVLGWRLQVRAMRAARRLALRALGRSVPWSFRGAADLVMAWDDGLRVRRGGRRAVRGVGRPF